MHHEWPLSETTIEDSSQLTELVAAAKLMCESLPVYSESSAAYTRKQRLDAAIADAENLLEYLRGEHDE